MNFELLDQVWFGKTFGLCPFFFFFIIIGICFELRSTMIQNLLFEFKVYSNYFFLICLNLESLFWFQIEIWLTTIYVDFIRGLKLELVKKISNETALIHIFCRIKFDLDSKKDLLHPIIRWDSKIFFIYTR